MTLLGLATLYRFGPSRRKSQWRWISVGSFVATVVWIAGSASLSFYLSNYADYDAMYGSLGVVISTISWMSMSTIVILFGAKLNS
jgi:membrane protein